VGRIPASPREILRGLTTSEDDVTLESLRANIGDIVSCFTIFRQAGCDERCSLPTEKSLPRLAGRVGRSGRHSGASSDRSIGET
jgi:hypothetical protein